MKNNGYDLTNGGSFSLLGMTEEELDNIFEKPLDSEIFFSDMVYDQKARDTGKQVVPTGELKFIQQYLDSAARINDKYGLIPSSQSTGTTGKTDLFSDTEDTSSDSGSIISGGGYTGDTGNKKDSMDFEDDLSTEDKTQFTGSLITGNKTELSSDNNPSKSENMKSTALLTTSSNNQTPSDGIANHETLNISSSKNPAETSPNTESYNENITKDRNLYPIITYYKEIGTMKGQFNNIINYFNRREFSQEDRDFIYGHLKYPDSTDNDTLLDVQKEDFDYLNIIRQITRNVETLRKKYDDKTNYVKPDISLPEFYNNFAKKKAWQTSPNYNLEGALIFASLIVTDYTNNLGKSTGIDPSKFYKDINIKELEKDIRMCSLHYPYLSQKMIHNYCLQTISESIEPMRLTIGESYLYKYYGSSITQKAQSVTAIQQIKYNNDNILYSQNEAFVFSDGIVDYFKQNKNIPATKDNISQPEFVKNCLHLISHACREPESKVNDQYYSIYSGFMLNVDQFALNQFMKDNKDELDTIITTIHTISPETEFEISKNNIGIPLFCLYQTQNIMAFRSNILQTYQANADQLNNEYQLNKQVESMSDKEIIGFFPELYKKLHEANFPDITEGYFDHFFCDAVRRRAALSSDEYKFKIDTMNQFIEIMLGDDIFHNLDAAGMNLIYTFAGLFNGDLIRDQRVMNLAAEMANKNGASSFSEGMANFIKDSLATVAILILAVSTDGAALATQIGTVYGCASKINMTLQEFDRLNMDQTLTQNERLIQLLEFCGRNECLTKIGNIFGKQASQVARYYGATENLQNMVGSTAKIFGKKALSNAKQYISNK